MLVGVGSVLLSQVGVRARRAFKPMFLNKTLDVLLAATCPTEYIRFILHT